MLQIFTKTVAIIPLFLIIGIGDPVVAMAADTIKIGHIDPFSGPFEYTGRLEHAGLMFVVDEYNAKGGLLGKKIEVFTADSELKPDVATRKAKKFIIEKKVNFLSHNNGSHLSVALNKLSKRYKTIYVNSGGMSDFIQGKEFSRYSFRFCQNAHLFISAFAQLMARTNYRRFYLINMDYAWGHDVSKAFKKGLKKYVPDAKIVGEDFHPIATKDFGPYITKVIAAKADCVFSGNWGPDARLLIKHGRALGLKVPFPFVMCFGIDPYIQSELKEDTVGVYGAYPYWLRVDTPENRDMITRYHAKHKNDEDFLTWWPYGQIGIVICAWQFFLAGVEKAGTLDPEKIIDTLEGMWYKTPVGWWQMRKCDHQAIIPMYGGRVVSGWNPYYNGSIRKDVNFPWTGKDMVAFPAQESAIEPTPDYNPRCP